MPSPENLGERHALVRRLTQWGRIGWNAFALGTGAFWGAVVSYDVQGDPSRLLDSDRLMAFQATVVGGPTLMALGLGLWFMTMALAFDVKRTAGAVRRERIESAVADVARLVGMPGPADHGLAEVVADRWFAWTDGWKILLPALVAPMMVMLLVSYLV